VSPDGAKERRKIDEIVAGQTVTKLFQDATAAHGEADYLRWKQDDEWRSLTWTQTRERVRDVAKGLIALGAKPGEFINLIGSNVPEYTISDFGILHAGAVPVSLYNSLAPEQIAYIVNNCDGAYVFCENRQYLETLLKIQREIGNVRRVIMWHDAEEFAGNEWIVSFDEMIEAGRGVDDAEYERRWQAVEADDLVTLIYTSGTTGPPKGVMISHYNVCWTLESFLTVMSLPSGTRQISYLPMAHIAERMVGHYGPLRIGSLVHFCPEPRQIAGYVRDVKPQYFFGVPRIWEKFHQGIQNSIEAASDDQRKAAHDALDVRLKVVRLELTGQDVPADLREEDEQHKPVTDFIRSFVGLDEVVVGVTGAAPLAREVIEFFWAIGVPVYEVYGQSEDTGPTSWNRPGATRLGTVGPAIPGVEVKLAEDGELLVRGGNVSAGYYKEPDLTAETFDDDGWLHSGDVAEITDDGFIKIVDRKKEILITAGGKNVAPSNVENLLKQHPLVGQAAMIADRRPYATALIALDPEDASEWAKARGKPADIASLSQDDEVRADIHRHIDEMNKQLHNQEQIKKFTILPNEWTIEGGEITPTLKMKRKVVNQKYEAEIESMYEK
jgi:long-chain acyl-CoA synthetase